MHHTTERFWRCFNKLPPDVQEKARASFELLKSNASHPSLHFKRTGRVWSARVDRAHRALAIRDGQDYIWIWIGSHDDYDRLIDSGP